MRHRRFSRRFGLLTILYLLFVVAAAVALWLFIPDEVKQAIFRTYVSPAESP